MLTSPHNKSEKRVRSATARAMSGARVDLTISKSDPNRSLWTFTTTREWVVEEMVTRATRPGTTTAGMSDLARQVLETRVRRPPVAEVVPGEQK